MVETTLATETEAVNSILALSGMAQISSLPGSGRASLTAEFLLEQANRDVQAEGWYFNTESDVEYSPDGSNYINLDSDELWVRHYAWGYDGGTYGLDEVCLRGERLYNLTDHTYEFDNDVHLTVVYHRPWEELPPEARQYITAKAATVFATVYVSNPRLERLTATREMEARATLENMQAKIRGYNSNQSMPIRNVMGRRSNRGGGLTK